MKHPIAQVLLPLVFACAADDGDAETTTAAPSTVASTTASTSSTHGDDGAATTMPGAELTTEPGDTGGAGEGSSDAATGGETGSTGGGGSTGSGSGGDDPCAPLPTDDDCVACAKQMCCEIYAACYGDPDCACAVDCILDTGDYATCLGPQCNTPDPTPAMDIGLCYGTTCADACGF